MAITLVSLFLPDFLFKSKKPVIFYDKDRGKNWKTEVKPIFNKDGNIVKLATYIMDITEKKGSEEKFSAIFQNSITWVTRCITSLLRHCT